VADDHGQAKAEGGDEAGGVVLAKYFRNGNEIFGRAT
jgi:hypothetical protein